MKMMISQLKFPHVLGKRSVLCNCEIKTGNHFPLESLTACIESTSKLIMYFAVNLAFVNHFGHWTNSL